MDLYAILKGFHPSFFIFSLKRMEKPSANENPLAKQPGNKRKDKHGLRLASSLPAIPKALKVALCGEHCAMTIFTLYKIIA
jgi:hypothetical protein